jgi:hypothetical protein
VSAQEAGTYVDPKLGRVTFAAFFREWSTRQIWESGTRHVMNLSANGVTFSDVALTDLRPSHFETWAKRMQADELKPTTIRTRSGNDAVGACAVVPAR